MKKTVSRIVLSIFILLQFLAILPKQALANSNSVYVVVESNQGIIAEGETQKTNALDALDEVLKSKGISYVLKDSGYGKYISEVNGLKEGSLGDYSGWMYAIQRDGKYEVPMTSIDGTELKKGEKLLLYYGCYPKPYLANDISFSTLSPNKALTITFNNYDDWTNTVTKIEGFKAEIDGKSVEVTENRIELPQGLNEGVHELKFYDFKEENEIPNIVADAIKFEIKKPKFTIRVEGLLDTIVRGEVEEKTALSGLEKLLNNNSISYTVKESKWGKYVEEINGLKAGKFGGYDGWMYYIKSKNKIETPMTSIESYIPNDGDEIVVFYGDSTTAYVNNIKFTPDIVEANKPFKIQFAYTYFDWYQNKEVTTPIAGAIVTVDEKNYITNENGEISIEGLEKGIHSYKISGYNVDKSPTVVKDEGVFNIDGVNSPSLDYRDSAYTEVISKNNNLIKKNIEEDLNLTLGYIEKNQLDMWAFLSLSKMGKKIDEKLIEDAAKELKSYGIDEYTNTDIEKLIITLTAAGYSPYNFAGYNLMEELYNKRSIDKFLINDAIFALLALDYTADKSSYKITREKLVEFILDKAITVNKNGKELYGWTLNSEMGINPDITGVALTALSPYMSNEKVKASVDKAVDSLSKMQIDSGYIPDSFGSFSETISFVILGLTAVGENPEGIKFTKTNGDLYSALLSFRVNDGQFAHELNKKADYMATEQALRALIAIREFKRAGKYNFFGNNVDVSKLKVFEYTGEEEAKKLLPKTGDMFDANIVAVLSILMILLGIVLIKKQKRA
ncbi:MAG: hypothetical protein JG776_2195 [Caloramator sp.]|jgi:LPXTG-motif cell wall-anchored protein|uniref:DUF4430 domain-containing protein n=1 Tax=Caloramator sp. TaxID=1871330 RepID=UPI001E143855|nr:DUF4430 domain-containing protein [Caloramator sp.]MBZ4664477.1 hypothetical protein [Caloramator sp.]